MLDKNLVSNKLVIFCFITTLIIASANGSIGAQKPNFVDMSISGIALYNGNSTKKVLDMIPEMHQRFYSNICSYDGKELLVLTFDPGHYVGAFSRFRVKHLDKPMEKCFKPVNKINHFVSGKGIKLGMTKEQLVQRLGSAYR